SAADYRFFAGRTREIGVRAGINLKRGYFNVTASVVNQKRDSISKMHLTSHKLNIYTSIPVGKTGNFTLSTNLLKNLPTSGIASAAFYTYNGFASLQTRSLGATFSYEQGPGIYYDPISFSNRNIDNSKYQFSPFIEKSFFKSTLNIRLQGDYQYNRNLGGTSVSARGDVSLDLKHHGMSLRVYGAKDIKTGLFKQDFLNFSIRKSFNVPLLGMKKYRSLKVVMFKDKNNNDVFDAHDEPVQKADFSINDQHFNTNSKGEAQYRNIPKGDYTIALGQITGTTGWIAKDGYEQTVKVKDDKALYIPFKESKFLAGKLNLVKDTYSNEGFNPGNIRVMAVNSKGETYNTLTNEKGEFSFNLPSDTYIVQINSNVFSDTFRVLQEAFNADLLNNQQEEIVFEVRERKRQINIIRQGQTYSFSQAK
ncbi:MAG TPA: carboxypeptidase-like regulatory domain-containing protein, partial [Daejeonella sp.]